MSAQISDRRVDVESIPSARLPDRSRRDAAAFTLLTLAAAQIPGVQNLEVLQLSGRGALAAFTKAGERFVFKLMTCRSTWRKRVARLFWWNPARRAYRTSVALESAGVPACSVVEHGRVRLPTAPRAVWTISRFYPHGITLRAFKRQLQPTRRSAAHPEVRALCSEGIDVLRRLHEAGFQHLDYHAGNLLVLPRDPGEGPTLRLLDLDTVVRRSPFASSRARELCRFIQNFVEPHDYREVIQTALEEYANGDRRMLKALERSRPVTRLLERRGVQTKDIVRARQATLQT